MRHESEEIAEVESSYLGATLNRDLLIAFYCKFVVWFSTFFSYIIMLVESSIIVPKLSMP